MWSYFQFNGSFWYNHDWVADGYSGHGDGLNNPSMESVVNVGPIPRGDWTIGEAVDDPKLGPLAMALIPYPQTNTFGRTSFFVHGDSLEYPGLEEASHGCIILSRSIRELIAASPDRYLEVE
jgi:hypothetical protein